VSYDRLLDVLRSRVPGLVAVYVFGSSETGGAHPASDLDLAVLAATRIDAMTRWELQERLPRARAARWIWLTCGRPRP